MASKPVHGALASVDSDYSAFYAINILALSILASSFVSGMWMILSIVRTKGYRSIGDRFPLYLAVSDVLFTLSHTIDHGYLLVTREFPDRWLCSVLGACLQLWLGAGITMAALVSITVYLRVYREYQVNWGSYEWGFLALAFGLNVACIVVGFALGNVFGPSKFWCYITTGTPEGAICNVTFNTVPVTTSFVICAFCYGMVYRKIVTFSRQLKDASSAGTNVRPQMPAAKEIDEGARSGIVKTAPLACGERVDATNSASAGSAVSCNRLNRPITKMMTYIAGYFVQWFVAVILALTMLTGNDETFLYVGTMVTVNAGGMIHALSYWYNRRADKRLGQVGHMMARSKSTNTSSSVTRISPSLSTCATADEWSRRL